jgi:diguanylate cyclase (GGDEF)-like protein/hemerythrin-like metal-binding protein/PAS domain S-box-containing protein
MDDSRYKKLIEASPIGYCFQRVLCDSAGNPYDHEYIEMNQAYEVISGLKIAESIGKKRSDFMHVNPDGISSLVKRYYEIAISGGSTEIEHFDELSQRHFRVFIYSPEKYYYAILVTDITREKKDSQEKTTILTALNDIVSKQKKLQDELVSQTEELERFFSVNLDLLCIADTEGNFLKVNKAWERILGYSTHELESRKFLEFVHPEDLDKTLETMAKLGKQDEVLNFVNRYRCKDGTYRNIEWRSHPYGNLIYAAARDITKRIEDERSIQVQKERFELAVRGSNDGIWDWDLITNAIYFSPKCKEQLGLDEAEMPNEIASFFSRLHPDDITLYMRTIDQYLKGKIPLYDLELRLQHKNGTYRWVRIRGEAVRDPAGLAYRMAGSQTDITAQKAASEALQNSEEKYRLIAENMSDVIWIYNTSTGKFSYISQSIMHLRGLTPEEAMTENLEASMTAESFKRFNEQNTLGLKRFLDNPEFSRAFLIEIQQPCKNGDLIWVELSAKLRFNTLGQVELFGVSRNIEERKKAETLQYIGNHDHLTGLYNRHYFETMIVEAMERSDRYKDPISMVLLDLDHFKVVNDTWGHQVGDEVLKLTAQTTGNTIRSSDILVRIGGEEFAILMPETTQGNAILAAEKIRKAIENHTHPITGTQTASIGVAERLKFESFRHWFKRLDDALYYAKQHGRNRVVASDADEILIPTLDRLVWQDEWACGEEEIDRQHQDLLIITRNLINQSTSCTASDDMMRELETLLDHIRKHFDYEEKVLLAIEYPEQMAHAVLHKNLLSKTLRLRDAFINEEIKLSAIVSILVDDVIIGHLLESDIKFFPYSRNIKR